MKPVSVHRILLVSTALLFGTPVFAQSVMLDPVAAPVEVEQLGAAQAFDPGVQPAGSQRWAQLSPQLWQGTPATRAAELLNDAPLGSSNPVVQDLLQAVLLSGGVPPEATDEAARTRYAAARFRAVTALADTPTREAFLARNPELAKTPMARIELALMSGQAEAVCQISDAVTEGRAAPEWARIRAVCHLLRDEPAAAELTRDLLRTGGYDNAEYHALFDVLSGARRDLPADAGTSDPLLRFMRDRIRMGDAPDVWRDYAKLDLGELAAAFAQVDVGTELSVDSALADRGPSGTAKLMLLAQSGNVAAIHGFVDRAVERGVPESLALRPFAALLSTTDLGERARVNLARTARQAARDGDIAALQQIHAALGEGPVQPRIALAADAVGGGFRLGALGRDIDGRLREDQARAQRDAVIALALGARPSDAASAALRNAALADGRRVAPGELHLLQAAADAGSQAETALRAARLLDGEALTTNDLAWVLRALQAAGLAEFAGRVAALDYLAPLGTPAP